MLNRYVGGSFVLHFVVIWTITKSGLNLFNSQNSSRIPAPSNSLPLSVRNITEKEFEKEMKAREKLRKSDQVVQMDEKLKSEEAPTTLHEKIFLSKYNQKADRNTQAYRIGKFKNVLEEGIADLTGSPKRASKVLEEPIPSPLGQTRAPTSILSRPDEEKVGKEGSGLSASDDFIKGVSIGPNTLLNTQEFKFYGFYERVREMLVERWKTHIQREISKQRDIASSQSNLSTGSKITSLIVKMDQEGNIKDIEKIGLSGIERFDEVAIQSFREAAPFPHPPQEMLKDGTLSIRWDFVVVVDQASFFEFKVSRGI